MDYEQFFRSITDHDPFPYQRKLGEEPWPDLLDIPTGLGKTAAVVVAWIYKRCIIKNKDTPRRLVYCLPMRVLVEQTKRAVSGWLKNLGKFAKLHNGTISVHLLMGGKVGRDWALYPEANSILIGTQDMLLSRALNRGYAAGRARWPMEFGLLNNDCLWVFDEVQVMSTGLATSLQLDAWHRVLRVRNPVDGFFRDDHSAVYMPSRSLWMSATMARHWLDSAVDWQKYSEDAWEKRSTLVDADFSHPRVSALLENRKHLHAKPSAKLEKPRTKAGKADRADLKRKTQLYIEELTRAVKMCQDANGLTLVILNTVERATALYDKLKKQMKGVDVRLVHSRFRPMERENWQEFLSGNSERPIVLISTQVVEAGVDISASVLFTELAPWSSMVQRFGRCARYPNQAGKIYWMDVGTDEASARPYMLAELNGAKTCLTKLDDAGLGPLIQLKETLDKPSQKIDAAALFPYDPAFVPRDKDLFDLFDTTPDLTGADIDISRFIRDGEELDALVFWRDVPRTEYPGKKERPDHRELCPVPFHALRGQAGTMLQHGRMWRWDYRAGWKELHQDEIEFVYPGQVFFLEKSCGGYDVERGWTGNPDDKRFHQLDEPDHQPTSKLDLQDAEEDDDSLSEAKWLTVLEHSRHVCSKLEEILAGLSLLAANAELKMLRLAARWHDRGKAHQSFMAKIRPELLEHAQSHLQGQPPAKAPKNAWRTPSEMASMKRPSQACGTLPGPDRRRPGFRHELASALGIMESLQRAYPDHSVFAWPQGLDKRAFGETDNPPADLLVKGLAVEELASLSRGQFDLLLYLVAAHHGKVRMSLRSSADDARTDVPDPCGPEKRQARGVRDSDKLDACLLPEPSDGILRLTAAEAPAVDLYLDPMELGLSVRYGPSWRERTQDLLEQLGPFRLAYLESLLRSADCRASQDEEEATTRVIQGA